MGQTVPIVEITEIPSYSTIRGQLQWNELQGYVYTQRGSAGAPDPIAINLEYGGYLISNVLEIRDGYASLHFKIGNNGYFLFDTSKSMFGDRLQIKDASHDNSLILDVGEFSANNLEARWNIDTSGKIRGLKLGGFVDTFRSFTVDLKIQGKTAKFEGDWTPGEKTGGFQVDFHQDEDIALDIDLSDPAKNIVLKGGVVLSKDLHFDISWKWKQGENSLNPGYFKINENSNEKNFKEISLLFTYQDLWGAQVSLLNVGLYVCVEWYWYNLILYIWPVIDIIGDIDIHLLLNGQWYYNVEDWINPP
jgi:hypothetical protein